jgi:hypothetical protein
VLATAHPTPSATASAPTRPTYFADVTLCSCSKGPTGWSGRVPVLELVGSSDGRSPAQSKLVGQPHLFPRATYILSPARTSISAEFLNTPY